MANAGYEGPFNGVILQKALVPGVTNARFIFNIEGKHIAVDTVTGEVTVLGTEDLLNSSNFRVAYQFRFRVAEGVKFPHALILRDSSVFGSFESPPPRIVRAPEPGGTVIFEFSAIGPRRWWTGTNGYVVYESSDSEGSLINIRWNIPYRASRNNSGNVTCNTANYSIQGGSIPSRGRSHNIDVTLTQVK